MKKLLLILLLLFPVHGAWAKEIHALPIKELFGIKFGQPCENLSIVDTVPHIFSKEGIEKTLIINPMISNKEFEIYGVICTFEENKVMEIKAFGPKRKGECNKLKITGITAHFNKKYNLSLKTKEATTTMLIARDGNKFNYITIGCGLHEYRLMRNMPIGTKGLLIEVGDRKLIKESKKIFIESTKLKDTEGF